MLHTFFYNIAEICFRSGLKDVVLSPGSRCAPLTIAFNRHPDICIKTISDERTAGYIGLGMALGTNNPVGLVCTSGTAAANYLSAISEAFYQNISLIVFTADRPAEWIDQQDGQAIRQTSVYGNHVKGSYTLPMNLENQDVQWHFNRILTEAIQLSRAFPAGPVHINVPFREPFYPDKDEDITFSKSLRIREYTSPQKNYKPDLRIFENLQQARKVLIIGGQQRTNDRIIEALSVLSDKHIPVIGDIISNLHAVNSVIAHPDNYLSYVEVPENLRPELLLTFGNSVISKSLKLFIRKNPPDQHWHIQDSDIIADPYQSITRVIKCDPEIFLIQLSQSLESKDSIFQKDWLNIEKSAVKAMNKFFSHKTGEFKIVHQFMNALPKNVNLHLANSMAVRYANFIGISPAKNIEIFSNRGTSGIDGCSSTAVGISLSNPEKQNFLLTGDMAFLYDRNAFWHNYKVANLKVLVLNNHGGGIFRMIDGPGNLPELDELFETKQKSSARHLAEEYSLKYFHGTKIHQDFFDYEGGAIFEYESVGPENNTIFKDFKKEMKLALNKNEQ